MWWVVLFYLLMSIVTLMVFGLDKRAARRGRSRISEKHLHLLELLGGFPGSLLAQRLFRHKRRKPRFFLVTWLIALLHITAWVAWWFAFVQ